MGQPFRIISTLHWTDVVLIISCHGCGFLAVSHFWDPQSSQTGFLYTRRHGRCYLGIIWSTPMMTKETSRTPSSSQFPNVPIPALLVFNWLRIRRISAPQNFNVINVCNLSSRNQKKKRIKKRHCFSGFFSAQVFKTACEFWNPEQFHEFPETILKWVTRIRTVVFPRISNLHNIIKIDVCGSRRSLALKPKRFLSPATSKPWGFQRSPLGCLEWWTTRNSSG